MLELDTAKGNIFDFEITNNREVNIILLRTFQSLTIMALDRSAIDKARALQNLPALTNEEFASLEGNGMSQEEKDAQAKLLLEQKEKDDAAAAETERLRLLEEEENKKPKVREMSDEEIMEVVARKTGKKVASWDDLKGKEEVDEEKKKEERDSAKISWALQNKIIKKSELENYFADSKDPKELVYRLRLQEAKKEDPNTDEKEFREEFEEEFGLDQAETSRRFKNGQDTLKRLSAAILKSTYGSVFEMDEKYSQYEQGQMTHAEQQKKVTEGAPAYKKVLDGVKSKLKKIKTQVTEGEEYEVEMLDESIDKVITMMSDPQWAAQQILKGYTEEEMQQTAWNVVLAENFQFIANEIKKQALLKKAAGTKGIVKIGERSNETQEVLTPEQEILKGIIEANKQKEPALN